MRRLACTALAFCLLFALVPGSASAATGTPSGWSKVGGTVNGYSALDFVSTKVGFSRRYTDDGQAVYRTTNGGSTWSKMGALPEQASLTDFVSSTKGYAVGIEYNYDTEPTTRNARFWVTVDGGKKWTAKGDGLPDQDYNAITVIGSDVWVAGDAETIAHSADGGTTWETQHAGAANSSNRFEAMYFLNATTGWATGAQFSPSYKGLICRTTDGGKTWQRATLTTGSKLRSVHFYDSKYGWAAGYEANKLLRTTDGGKTWKSVSSKTFTDTPIDFAFVSRSKGWLATWGGLLQTKDGGKTWTKYLSGYSCTSMSSVGRSRVWVNAAKPRSQKYQLYRWTK